MINMIFVNLDDVAGYAVRRFNEFPMTLFFF